MRILRLLISFFLVFAIIFTFFFGLSRIGSRQKPEATPTLKGIISIWQVDSFEGGTGSRRKYLLSIAKEFEKQNQGVLIMVTNYDEQGVNDNFNKGVFPDMISFGVGTDVKNYGEISLNAENFNAFGGKINGKTYAVPWCRGGYALVRNTKITTGFERRLTDVVASVGAHTQPLTALGLSGYTAEKIETLSPMEAYVKFVSGKTPYFLCTQRDLIRLNNRGYEYDAVFLDGYNDLFQYMSITSSNVEKYTYCEKFLNFLLSESSQKKLENISMFSPYYEINYDGKYSELSKNSNFNTISAFSDLGVLEKLYSLSSELVMGNGEAEIKIKNILLVP